MRYIFTSQYSRDIAYHSHTGDNGGCDNNFKYQDSKLSSFFTSPHAHHDRILSPPFMNENGVDSRAPHLAYPDYNCRLYGKWCNRCSYWGTCKEGRRGA